MSDKPYIVGLEQKALKGLNQLSPPIAERIAWKLLWLAANVQTIDHFAMSGNWSGFFRWRIGDYRVIYTIIHEERLIIVAEIGHRRDVYDG